MQIHVAVLGATGTVGQKIITLLEQHPRFQVSEVSASERSNGRLYAEATHWREHSVLPKRIAGLRLKNPEELKSAYAISALPAEHAKSIEPMLMAKGVHVISNASAFRMQADVPLCVPEINLEHLSLIQKQKTKGKLITNPNCSTVFAVLGLHPLKALGEIQHVHIVTLQALSGAGYPGVSSSDILGNIIPNISGEESKIEAETKKILGLVDSPAEFSVTAHVHRVPVLHGHTVAMHVHFKQDVKAKTAQELFSQLAQQKPELYQYHSAWDRPQPLRDLTEFDQRAHIGRVKQGDRSHILGFISMGHNLVRGAAGAALVNLEAAVKRLTE